MGMIGAKYEFLCVDHVDVGISSRNFDPNWANCSLRKALENKNINIPDSAPLPHRTKNMSFVSTGDVTNHSLALAKLLKSHPYELRMH